MQGLQRIALLGLLVPSTYSTATILPPNDLHLQDIKGLVADITKDEFNNIVNEIVDIYTPYAESLGYDLKANNNWDNSTVNASAVQRGNAWYINMYGGLARRPEVTKDGFALVVCHEIGHHFGGFPFVGGFFNRWAANEGQSDYFASQACARLVWQNDTEENAKFRENVDGLVQEACDQSWSTEAEQNLCYRVIAAGQSLADLLAALGGAESPSLKTPDESEVGRTSHSHPKAQCRLDTYFKGALCTVDFDPENIPGKDGRRGSNSIVAEREAMAVSCSHQAEELAFASRPRCWFKPRNL